MLIPIWKKLDNLGITLNFNKESFICSISLQKSCQFETKKQENRSIQFQIALATALTILKLENNKDLSGR